MVGRVDGEEGGGERVGCCGVRDLEPGQGGTRRRGVE